MRALLLLILSIVLIPVYCMAQTPIDKNHVEIAPGVIRVSKNIAYRGEDGKLHVSRPEFVPSFAQGIDYQCETTELKVYVGTETASWSTRLKYRDKTLDMKLEGLVYYDSAAGKARLIAEPNYSRRGLLPEAENKAWCPNIFPGMAQDNHLYYEGLLPLIAIARIDLLPPAENGEDYLGIMREIDLTSIPGYCVAISRSKGTADLYYGSSSVDMTASIGQITPRLLTGDTTRQRRITVFAPVGGVNDLCFGFEDHKAKDSSGEKEKEQCPTLKVFQRIDEKDYYLELIPLAWLNQAVLPVSFGSAIYSGHSPNPDEVFEAGNTYLVEDFYNVKSLTSIGTPDNPVVVKFMP